MLNVYVSSVVGSLSFLTPRFLALSGCLEPFLNAPIPQFPDAFHECGNDVGMKSSAPSSATSSAFLLAFGRPGRRVGCNIFNRSALNEVIIRSAYDLPSVMSGTGIVVAANWVPERTGSTVRQNGLERRQNVHEQNLRGGAGHPKSTTTARRRLQNATANQRAQDRRQVLGWDLGFARDPWPGDRPTIVVLREIDHRA